MWEMQVTCRKCSEQYTNRDGALEAVTAAASQYSDDDFVYDVWADFEKRGINVSGFTRTTEEDGTRLSWGGMIQLNYPLPDDWQDRVEYFAEGFKGSFTSWPHEEGALLKRVM